MLNKHTKYTKSCQPNFNKPVQQTSAQITRIELDLLDYCNLQCPGCPTPQGKNQLDWKKIKSHIRYIATRNEIDDITICGNGGEPSLHPLISDIIIDLAEIFPYTVITLASNGENIKYLDFKALSYIGKRLKIEWSVDGHTQELHSITRVGGHLDKVMNNIKESLKYDFDIAIYTTRHLKNENFINQIYNFIVSETGIIPEFRDTTRVVPELNLFHPTTKSKNGNVTVLNPKNNINPSFERLQTIYGIRPNFNFYFNPDGRLYPCAAFYYNDFKIPSLDAYEYGPEELYYKFNDFSKEYCNYHRTNLFCDWKRCCLECGVDNTFKFDSFEEVSSLGNK